MGAVDRPAARVICLDADYRLLLLHWRDPKEGTWLWEPPGGGLEPGETPLTAARRELVEETGLDRLLSSTGRCWSSVMCGGTVGGTGGRSTSSSLGFPMSDRPWRGLACFPTSRRTLAGTSGLRGRTWTRCRTRSSHRDC
ncbi:NUDIX hydrolase [Streptomyces alkaliterrae]|uniref:NUDIX hydrolase n=1 Tax=Streptomyces alkaliterrae TaxID=2213162 RepID=UPI002B1F0717|nr:NUDIX hydrolase [Streptomyces alkaliterrae]